MALKIHSVVQDAYDFDRPSCRCPVHQEETPATTVPRNVERAEIRHDLITGLGPRKIGTVDKLADRLNERVPID